MRYSLFTTVSSISYETYTTIFDKEMLHDKFMGEYSIYIFGINTLRILKHLKLFTLKHYGCSACFKMNEARER